MNFIPLICVFIVILGITSISFTTKQRGEIRLESLSAGRIRSLREGRNRREDEKYVTERLGDRAPTRAERKNPAESREPIPEQTGKPKTYFRITQTGSSSGAINLQHIVEGSGGYDLDLLREIAIDYLFASYSRLSSLCRMEKREEARELVRYLIEEQRGKKARDIKEIDRPPFIVPDRYRKMLRGTRNIDFERNIGYLPLDRIITFTETDFAPIRLHFANPRLLATLFSQKGYEAIKAYEWPGGRHRNSDHTRYSITTRALRERLSIEADEDRIKLLEEGYHLEKKPNIRRGVDAKTKIASPVLIPAKRNPESGNVTKDAKGDAYSNA
ncbi:MAG: hypothetical protein OXF02_06675 [Simkaniaceae bacterium]|nr:hypothetical protein [Simkaniaceae bacterium]